MPHKNALADLYRKPVASQSELDRIAIAQGYNDYADMIYSKKNRLPPRRQPGNTTSVERGRFSNVLRDLWNDPAKALQSMFSWHPANTIGRASQALQDTRR